MTPHSSNDFVEVSHLDIGRDNGDGQRIDNFLLKILKGVPRSRVYRLLRTGQVRVNGGRVKPTHRLKVGDRLRIPPVRTGDRVAPHVPEDLASVLTGSILFEDEHFLAINKPAGMAVHSGSGVSAGVIEYLREMRSEQYLELVHRLDRGTSGCLLIAKRRSALVIAQQAIAERSAKKHYQLIVHGNWPARVSVVQLRLHKVTMPHGEQRVRVAAAGKHARTDFEVLARTAGVPRATRLRAILHTGRTHQIRVHAQAKGHPLVGDEKYGPRLSEVASGMRGRGEAGSGSRTLSRAVLARSANDLLEAKGGAGVNVVPRLCLHAERLVLTLDRDASEMAGLQRIVKVEAPPPDDFEAVWRCLCGVNTI